MSSLVSSNEQATSDVCSELKDIILRRIFLFHKFDCEYVPITAIASIGLISIETISKVCKTLCKEGKLNKMECDRNIPDAYALTKEQLRLDGVCYDLSSCIQPFPWPDEKYDNEMMTHESLKYNLKEAQSKIKLLEEENKEYGKHTEYLYDQIDTFGKLVHLVKIKVEVLESNNKKLATKYSKPIECYCKNDSNNVSDTCTYCINKFLDWNE